MCLNCNLCCYSGAVRWYCSVNVQFRAVWLWRILLEPSDLWYIHLRFLFAFVAKKLLSINLKQKGRKIMCFVVAVTICLSYCCSMSNLCGLTLCWTCGLVVLLCGRVYWVPWFMFFVCYYMIVYLGTCQHRVSPASLFKRVVEKAEQWLLACLYGSKTEHHTIR